MLSQQLNKGSQENEKKVDNSQSHQKLRDSPNDQIEYPNKPIMGESQTSFSKIIQESASENIFGNKSMTDKFSLKTEKTFNIERMDINLDKGKADPGYFQQDCSAERNISESLNATSSTVDISGQHSSTENKSGREYIHRAGDEEDDEINAADDDYDDDEEDDDDDDDDDLSSSFEDSLTDGEANEESLLFGGSGSGQKSYRTSQTCLPQFCQTSAQRNSKKRRRRPSEANYQSDEELFVLKAIMSPLFRLWTLGKEAFELVTDVENAWDSPASDPTTDRVWLDSQYNENDPGVIGSSASAQRILSISGNGSRNSRDDNFQKNFRFKNDENTPSHVEGSDFVPTHRRTKSPSPVSFRRKLAVSFWFFVLAIAYATEQCTFKVLADKSGPFRLVIGGQFLPAIHAIILGLCLGINAISKWKEAKNRANSDQYIAAPDTVNQMVMLPWTDVAFMAILDTIHLLLLFVSGSHVTPTLTIILVQFTIPLTSIFAQFIHPDGKCYGLCAQNGQKSYPPEIAIEQVTLVERENNISQSSTHQTSSCGGLTSQQIFGSAIISLSSFMALSMPIATLAFPNAINLDNIMTDRTAWNTILFACSCIPAAISQMYKEHSLITHARPVNSNCLNFMLSTFSFFFALVLSPLFYALQGFAATPQIYNDLPNDISHSISVQSWIHLYPSSQMKANFHDAGQCVTGTLNQGTQIGGYAEAANCNFTWGLLLINVWAVLTVSYAVDKICNAGAMKIMHRGISAGILTGFSVMMYYQTFVKDFDYGFIHSSWHIACVIVLLMGSEVYHRASLEEPMFETTYESVSNIYES